MKKSVAGIFTCLLAVIGFAVCPAWAIDWDLKGSLGEGKHKHYVPPVSNPILNETPFITTEVRPFYMNHSIPDTVPGLGLPGGGSVNIWAVQLRVALTERLGFIANKDGWADVNFQASSILPIDDDGLANLGFGFKYALISDPKQETLVTVGLTYEAPTGRLKAGPFWLQGNGDGFLIPFVTAAKSYDKLGLQAMLGTKHALDGDKNASWFNYSLHMDYEILPNFYPLVEFNGFIPIDEANLTPFAFEGFDVVSIGGSNVSSVVSFAGGARYKIMDHLLAGIAYEIPLTDDEDILDWRLTADLVIYF
jgi:hypothetical protein